MNYDKTNRIHPYFWANSLIANRPSDRSSYLAVAFIEKFIRSVIKLFKKKRFYASWNGDWLNYNEVLLNF